MISGNGGEVFDTKICPILEIVAGTLETGRMRVPWVEQKGSFKEEKQKQPFSPRLMFYRGLTKSSLNEDYPYLTNDNRDRTGQLLEGKRLSLRFEGEYGLYNQLWKNYLTWWMSRKWVYWNIKDPSALRFNEKYAIDGKHYLLKKRTINLSSQGVQPAECEFYLV